MTMMNDVHSWIAPTLARTSLSKLGDVQRCLSLVSQNASFLDSNLAKGRFAPVFNKPKLMDLDSLEAWLELTIRKFPLLHLSWAQHLMAHTTEKVKCLCLGTSRAFIEQAFGKAPLTLILYSAVTLLIGYALLLGIYNAFFHPLAKFPGPRLAALCQGPYTCAALKGKHYLWVKKLHDYYDSDVVRTSPNELSFIGPSAWKDITGGRAGRPPFEQDERVHGKPPNPDRAVSMLTAKLPDHSRMRRVLDHAFSSKAFQEQQPVLESYVRKLIDNLREQVHYPRQGDVDLVKWLNWTTFDIIGDFSFGESFNCLGNQDNHPWLNTVFGNLKVVTFIGLTSRFFVFRKLLPYLIPKRAKEQTRIHFAYLDEKITKRIELGTDRPDFITPMLKHNVKGKGMTPAEIRANMGLMIVAGSESVVTVTCGAIYYMLKNPATMQRLIAEVRDTFKSEADINSKSVPQLKYLTAVINESLRLYPSTPGLPACRVPQGGSIVSGHWVAGNTGVSISQYAAFRSPRNFKDPDSFIPERWLGDPRFADDKRDVFHPFSCGPRSCIGKAMGDMEVRLILTQLIYNFDLELMEETKEDWEDQVVYLTWQKNPLLVRLSLASHDE